jgi:hypothetical protein
MSDSESGKDAERGSVLLALIMGGLGGTLPTLTRILSFYISNPSADLPVAGFYVGLLLFFIIGMTISFAMAEHNPKQALFVGMAAPTLITNASQGLDEAEQSRAISLSMDLWRLLQSDYVQEIGSIINSLT